MPGCNSRRGTGDKKSVAGLRRGHRGGAEERGALGPVSWDLGPRAGSAHTLIPYQRWSSLSLGCFLTSYTKFSHGLKIARQ